MSLRTDLEKLPDCCWQNASVKITALKTETELIYAVCDCQLADEQKEMVNPAWFSIKIGSRTTQYGGAEAVHVLGG